ncbi:AraC family transcriptional regulator [Plastoroseomonas hellenica]|uniref:AraC family transcriptional regulator n=1 Tax=Plastoroseomonas hellenica TaxID=2687306 RepID=UPI001BAB9334|nr:AraC family transcriptional regulator [Plastoroseomonas hellenica]MBR0645905.1 AraC family transcriptional regulator [Plastoroseomonas hellenica]
MSTTEILAGLIDRFTGEDGIHETAIPNLALVRCSRPTVPLHGLHKPALCIIAQGRKQVILGDAIHHYDSARYLVASVDVPVIGQVLEATAPRPYLCIRLDLNLAVLSELALELGLGRGNAEPGPSLAVSPVTTDLLDAAARLVRLLGSPHDIPPLAPLAEREILYRLLTGEQGARLCQIAHAGSRLQQVNRAITWIRANFDRPFRIEQVAAAAHMSASALHEHFKAVTAMTPLQYQKQLRLQEARRLILSQAMDAASAGHSVGYESPSQFSREYSRLFGAPPIRDIARLRAEPFATAAV